MCRLFRAFECFYTPPPPSTTLGHVYLSDEHSASVARDITVCCGVAGSDAVLPLLHFHFFLPFHSRDSSLSLNHRLNPIGRGTLLSPQIRGLTALLACCTPISENNNPQNPRVCPRDRRTVFDRSTSRPACFMLFPSAVFLAQDISHRSLEILAPKRSSTSITTS